MNIGDCSDPPPDPPGTNVSVYLDLVGTSVSVKVNYTCMGNTSLTQLITCDGTSNTWKPSLSLDCPPVITSPNFPENYNINEEFEKLIEVPKGKIIYIQFTHFNIEWYPSDPCHYDWVMIIDGNGTELLPKSCGVDIPGDVVSLTNKVTVKFSSDQYGTRSGFRLIYAETGEIIIC